MCVTIIEIKHVTLASCWLLIQLAVYISKVEEANSKLWYIQL